MVIISKGCVWGGVGAIITLYTHVIGRQETLIALGLNYGFASLIFLQWNDVQEFLTKPTDKPVVLNRSSHTNSSNPFGATHCYGYQNIIFEVGDILMYILIQQPASYR